MYELQPIELEDGSEEFPKISLLDVIGAKVAQDHSKDFMDWLREKVDLILKEGHDNISDHIGGYQKMKGNRHKVVSQIQVPEYELQRLQKLKLKSKAKMDALESSNHEDGSNSKDPYSEVISNPKRKSRVRLHGKGLTTAVLTQLREANSGINLVIPDFVMPSAPNDASSTPRQFIDQNGQSSKYGGTVNQATTQPCTAFSSLSTWLNLSSSFSGCVSLLG
uniref:Uncharacterized protein n=1 Tax=Chenopodium quinoa TaxID=63459 RepID=A0A803MNA8_CHEQI